MKRVGSSRNRNLTGVDIPEIYTKSALNSFSTAAKDQLQAHQKFQAAAYKKPAKAKVIEKKPRPTSPEEKQKTEKVN